MPSADERASAVLALKQVLRDHDIHRAVRCGGADAQHQTHVGGGEIAITGAQGAGPNVVFDSFNEQGKI